MVYDATSLLDEVAAGKITGEEEAFSHNDLTDFQANVDGSKGAIQAPRPVLSERNPQLVADLDARFADVQKLLDAQRAGDTSSSTASFRRTGSSSSPPRWTRCPSR